MTSGRHALGKRRCESNSFVPSQLPTNHQTERWPDYSNHHTEIQRMALKRERSTSPTLAQDVFRSASIKEQTSLFIGAFSPTLSAKALQSLPEFKTATHKIAAWRKRSRQKSLVPDTKVLYDLGHDDDGESWAGRRLQNVLTDTQVEGTVVVARWYGGQNIGPIRFTHMETCAKEAILKWKVADTAARDEQTAKKQKIDDEIALKELRITLQERDYNIFALRKLLAEKKAKLNDEELTLPTPQKPQDYSRMALDALRRVDKARDATIAFILKQIDKIEEELKLVEALDDGTQDVLTGPEQKEEQKGNEKEDQKEAPSMSKVDKD